MAEAQITIKLSPAEFDLLRDALVDSRTRLLDSSRGSELPAAERQKGREKVIKLDDLIFKLK